MARSVSKCLKYLVNCVLLFSFCSLLVVCTIDVVPGKQKNLECAFYCCLSLCLISLVVRLIMLLLHHRQNGTRHAP